MKTWIRKFVPGPLLAFYHIALAYVANLIYGKPSRKLVVVGVTGTKGKTSTANFIWAALNSAGFKAGIVGTATIGTGRSVFLNPYHMTMPGRFKLHSFLSEMVKNDCRAAVIETTSEGIAQFRHYGIAYDIVVFTNITPEHIESHGSFENYRAQKQKIFSELSQSPRKTIDGRNIEKIIIASADTPESSHFLKFPADRKLTYGISQEADVRATQIKNNLKGVSFAVGKKLFRLRIAGSFNAVNAIPAIIIGNALGLDPEKIRKGLESLPTIPGRMEIVATNPYAVIVDYAHEPESMKASLGAGREIIGQKRKLISIFGATGGGRDKAKRPEMGRIAAELSDYVILTTDDPYDERPSDIIAAIAAGTDKIGKEEYGKTIFKIEDRRQAIQKGLRLANKGDLVLILGMGAEQSFIAKGKMIPWNDRVVAREELEKLKRS